MLYPQTIPTPENDPFQDLETSRFNPLTKNLILRGEHFDIGSDWHLAPDDQIIDNAVALLRRSQRSDRLFIVGDIVDTSTNGIDSSPWINRFLSGAAQSYRQIFFVPGNHDLRSRQDPWASFALPENVVMPVGVQPVKVQTERNTVLLGNLFYDLNFVDPHVVGLDMEEALAFYRAKTDGQHLFNGSLESFPTYTAALAKELTDDVHILITHALPYPSGVIFRVVEKTPQVVEYESTHHVQFVCDPEHDEIQAEKYGLTPQQYRSNWNKKSIFMGSNVLTHPEAKWRDGLTCIYGHNHRSTLSSVRIGSKIVNFYSYQDGFLI